MLSILKKLTIFFLGAALIGGTIGAATAAAATLRTGTHAVGLNFKGGPGHWGTVWAGTWNNGKRGFCLDFGKAMPNRAGTSVVAGKIAGMTAEESKQAKSVANKYAATGSREAAANAGFAIWRLQHDSAFNGWYSWARSKGVVSAARHNAISAILADAAQHAPYKMSISTNQMQVGQPGSGTVKVLGSNGRPAVGLLVALTATGGKILTVNGVKGYKGTARSTGVRFTYVRTATGMIGFKAALLSPSSARAGISRSSAGHQRTLSGGFGETAVATLSYDKTAGQPTITQACETNCGGLSAVTFRSANPSGAQAITWTMKVGTAPVATLSVKAGTTGTAAKGIVDGTVITSASYCYTGSVLGGPCTTAPVVVPTRWEIVCPVWAAVEMKKPCNCASNLPITATWVSPAGSPRFYRGFIIINKGAVSYPVDLVNGKPASITTGRLGKGTNVLFRFTVYRDAARTIPMGSHDLWNIVTIS